jgi:hypothetical protein
MPPFSGLTERFKKTFAPAINAVSNFVAQPAPKVYSAPQRTQSTAPASSTIPASTSPTKVNTPTPTAMPTGGSVNLDPRFAGMSAGKIADTLENERRDAERAKRRANITPEIGDTTTSDALSPDNTTDSLVAQNQKRMQDLFAKFDTSESETQAQAEINRLTEEKNALESKKKKRVAELMKNTEGLTEVGLERVVRGEEAAFDDQIADLDTQLTGFKDNVTSIQKSRQDALNNIKLIQDMTGEEQIGGIQTDPLTGEQTAYFRNPLTGEVTTRQLGTVSIKPEIQQIVTDQETGEIFALQINPTTGQLEQVSVGSITATPRLSGTATAAQTKLQQKQEDKILTQENILTALEKYKVAVDRIKDKGIAGAYDLNFDPTITRLRGELGALYKDAYSLGALDAGVERLVNNILGLNISSKISPSRHAEALDGLIKDTKEKIIFKDETGKNVSLNTVGGGEVIIDDLDFTL